MERKDPRFDPERESVIIWVFGPFCDHWRFVCFFRVLVFMMMMDAPVVFCYLLLGVLILVKRIGCAIMIS